MCNYAYRFVSFFHPLNKKVGSDIEKGENTMTFSLAATMTKTCPRIHILRSCIILISLGISISLPAFSWGQVVVTKTYSDQTDIDQDDMCIWVHPLDPTQSTIIGSDKGSGNIYVYDLDGTVIQKFSTGQPGNIDIRHDIQFNGEQVDLVAFNERMQKKILVYQVDPISRELIRIDDDNIQTGDNYGFTLYQHNDGRLFAYTGPQGRCLVSQYQLQDNQHNKIARIPKTKPPGMVNIKKRKNQKNQYNS